MAAVRLHCAPPPASHGTGGDDALTLKPDHPMGAGHSGRDPGEISVSEIAGLLQSRGEILSSDDPVLALARALDLSALRDGRRTALNAVLEEARSRIADSR